MIVRSPFKFKRMMKKLHHSTAHQSRKKLKRTGRLDQWMKRLVLRFWRRTLKLNWRLSLCKRNSRERHWVKDRRVFKSNRNRNKPIDITSHQKSQWEIWEIRHNRRESQRITKSLNLLSLARRDSRWGKSEMKSKSVLKS